jgi:putative FmdB family regulatory protein
MPIFDVVCPTCQKKKEVLYVSSDKLTEEPPKCDACGSEMSREFSSQISFRINGYCYNNEYKKPSIYRDIKPK